MLPGLRTSIACALAVTLTAVASCTTPGDGEPTVRIAFLQDLSVPDHVDLVSPSFLAFDMMVQRRLEDRGVVGEVVQFDTAGDETTAIEIAEQVAADP
ncbi:MAG TPA: hypothetical protein VH989_09500, partial [Actinomycetota bacterium]